MFWHRFLRNGRQLKQIRPFRTQSQRTRQLLPLHRQQVIAYSLQSHTTQIARYSSRTNSALYIHTYLRSLVSQPYFCVRTRAKKGKGGRPGHSPVPHYQSDCSNALLEFREVGVALSESKIARSLSNQTWYKQRGIGSSSVDKRLLLMEKGLSIASSPGSM